MVSEQCQPTKIAQRAKVHAGFPPPLLGHLPGTWSSLCWRSADLVDDVATLDATQRSKSTSSLYCAPPSLSLPFIKMTSIDIYTVPRDQVDVEALARLFVKYLQINAIDVQELSEHPQSRDAIIAELYARPETKPTFWPKDTVGADLPPEKYDEYLAHVDAAIEQLTPPKSLEDRVLRSHLAGA
ncbi:hypothetical protein C8Q72DRAFT_439184 [Fomitopsis betulina]|nr:hypothetical protein C8Q72DRAFT_439184 [Fomitopsis betulina]